MVWLEVTLLSDGCFAGSWQPLLLDADRCQELDPLGLPRIGGRALRGLLQEEVAVLVRGLPAGAAPAYRAAATALFGSAGQPERADQPVGADQPGRLRLGDAQLPAAVREVLLSYARHDSSAELARLAALATTVLRGQTKLEGGVARDGSLRHTRLLRAGQVLTAPIGYLGGELSSAPPEERALLSVAARLLRRGGLHRSRGWGRLRCQVLADGQDTGGWGAPLLTLLEAA